MAIAWVCHAASAAAPSPQAVAARVNGEEITTAAVNAVEPSLNDAGPHQASSAQKTLQALIDEQLLVQQADSAKLDRDPQVMTAIQDARRAVLIHEWLKREVGNIEQPSDESIASYYAAHPSAFSQRQIFYFRVAEIGGRPEQLQAIEKQCATSTSLVDAERLAELAGLSSHENTVEKSSEQLPEDLRRRLAGGRAGNQLFINLLGTHLEVAQLTSSRPDPIDLPEAKPSIARILVNQWTKDRVDAAVTELRTKAKIELVASTPANGASVGSAPQTSVEEDIAHGLK